MARSLLRDIDSYCCGLVVEDYDSSYENIDHYRRHLILEALDSEIVRRLNRMNVNGRKGSKPGDGIGVYASFLDELNQEPTFATYVNSFLKRNIALSDSLQKSSSLGQAIVKELTAIKDRLSEEVTESLPKVTLVSEIRDFSKHQKACERINAFDHEGLQGRLILNSEYFYTVGKIIDGAQRSIDIIMFFMSFSSSGDHPVNALIDKLIAASLRGVKVRVYLDKDQEGDLYKSRIINRLAYEALKNAGIDVRWDRVTSLSHSKIVVVDQEIVVMGSHNWTASSFFQYSEVSVLIKDRMIATSYQEDFEKRFLGK